jgi:hypothetical protein
VEGHGQHQRLERCPILKNAVMFARLSAMMSGLKNSERNVEQILDLIAKKRKEKES